MTIEEGEKKIENMVESTRSTEAEERCTIENTSVHAQNALSYRFEK